MNIKMTTNSQLSTTECRKQTKQTTRTGRARNLKLNLKNNERKLP